ncbi:MAG TPA: hypothetical protein IAA75_08220 [Candidatus Pullichristensenella avicola]|nr:hypothetical protein [Candidatus Pullichristensenella avicola]
MKKNQACASKLFHRTYPFLIGWAAVSAFSALLGDAIFRPANATIAQSPGNAGMIDDIRGLSRIRQPFQLRNGISGACSMITWKRC